MLRRIPLRRIRGPSWRVLFLALMMGCLALILWTGAWAMLTPSARRSASPVHPLFGASIAPLGLAAGLWVLALAAESRRLSYLAYALALGSAAMASGKLATLGSDLGARAFYGFLIWAVPVVYHLHQRLLAQPPGCLARGAEVLLIVLGAAIAVPVLCSPFARLEAAPWFLAWRRIVLLAFGVGVGLSWSLLAMYWLEGWPEGRSRQIRLIFFGNVIAVAPVLFFTSLPDGLGSPVGMGYNTTWPALLLAPITYIHALAPLRGRVDAAVRQAIAGYLVAVLFAGALLATMALLHGVLHLSLDSWPLFGLIQLAVFAMARPALWEWALRLTEAVWMGRGASYNVVVGRLAESLSGVPGPAGLQRSLVHKLSRVMHIAWAALYLRTESGSMAMLESHGLMPTLDGMRFFPDDGQLAAHLSRLGRPVSRPRLERALQGAPLEHSERSLLALERVALWVPLVAGGELHGVLLVGPKQGSDPYTREDLAILATMARQAAVALQSARLMAAVEVGREELARAHQQLLDAGEQERLRLARDLHDGAVQQLIAISYQLAAGKRLCDRAATGEERQLQPVPEMLDTARRELLDVVSQLRALIGELRPAGLEDLGLEAALGGYVARLQRVTTGGTPGIGLSVDIDDRFLPQRVALALFRVAQEGLRNALRHARASHVDVRLVRAAGGVELLIVDDGQGFSVPPRLSDLANQNHYGLVSISERVAQVGGRLSLHSVPGVGTELSVFIPLDQEADGGDGEDLRALGGRSPAREGRGAGDPGGGAGSGAGG